MANSGIDAKSRFLAEGGSIQQDIVYGQGLIGWSAPRGPVARALKMDVYLPATSGQTKRPALIMAFGGAFHRGSKENDSFSAEAGNTSVADYCALFALQGYVAFSIDYRLIPEDPAPGSTVVIQSPDLIPTSRIDVVRKLMGLPPATSEMIWRGMEAASDDLAAAAHFVCDNAARWNVDARRIALGGFSAGARSALNAALGEGAPVSAVISLSGYVSAEDMSSHLRRAKDGPSVLLVYGDQDLDYVRSGTPAMAEALREAGRLCDVACVAGSGHFYRADAHVVQDGGNQLADHQTVQQAMSGFLERNLAR